jgi:subfamily B ATP-binding cassette protein MsbA
MAFIDNVATPSTSQPTSLWTALALGLSSLRPHPWLAAGFLSATFLQGAMQALTIWALRNVLMGFSDPERAGAAMVMSAALIFGVWTARSASAVAAEMVATSLAYTVEFEWVWRSLSRLLRLPIRFFDQNSHGNVVTNCHYDIRGVRAVTFELGRMVLHASQLVGLGVVAWWLSPQLTVIGLLVVPIGLIPAYWTGRRITRAASRERGTITRHYDNFLQISAGIRIIKVNRCEQRVFDLARQIGTEMHMYALRQARNKGLARLVFGAVGGLGLAIVLAVGGRAVALGTMPWQSLLGLMVAIIAVYQPLVGLLDVYNNVRSVIPNLQGLDGILSAPVDTQNITGVRRLREAPETIELRDVSFAYGVQPAISDLSFSVRRGETIGLVGPSGAGKSTLLSLLLRFYTPTSGAILVDGVDLREIALDDWMDMSALVLQEPFIFVDTVANNIRSGRPEATLDEVVEAARAADIHEDIVRMEHGYDTVVGRASGARGLSGGQKQRICIAAALLKNAPLLFLDEATNSLDTVSEQKVQKAVERLMRGRTTFVIAHRFSTLRHADRILVLDDGRLVGSGRHEELLRESRLYRELWHQQAPGRDACELPAAAS